MRAEFWPHGPYLGSGAVSS